MFSKALDRISKEILDKPSLIYQMPLALPAPQILKYMSVVEFHNELTNQYKN
jgi:hypothetical protein